MPLRPPNDMTSANPWQLHSMSRITDKLLDSGIDSGKGRSAGFSQT
jgi:hypothetical protein